MEAIKLIKFKKHIIDMKKEDIQELSVKFEVEDKFNDGTFTLPLEVSGIAITEGIHKENIYYPAEELAKVAQRLEGTMVILRHNKESILSRVGRVTKSWFNPDINGIEFEAWIEDEKIASKVYHGLIDGVSVGVRGKRIPTEEGVTIATGLSFTELSLVGTPADFKARIKPKR